ncbi:MAG: hypothetical protein ACFB0D_14025 [Phormidesmis sp.]
MVRPHGGLLLALAEAGPSEFEDHQQVVVPMQALLLRTEQVASAVLRVGAVGAA